MHLQLTSTFGLLLALFSSASLSSAATFLIDLGDNSTTTGYPAGGTWNIYNATTVKAAGNLLKDSTGSTSGLTFLGAGTIAQGGSPGSSTFNFGSVPSGLSWLATTTAYAAAADWLYTSTGSGDYTQTYTFSGLTPGDVFSLDVISSRNATALGKYSYSLDGGSTWIGFSVVDSDGNAITTGTWATNTTLTANFSSQTDGYTNFRYMNATDVVLTGNTLRIRAEDVNADASFSGINAMRFTIVPEPSAITLPLAALGLALLRRNR